jgi:hypothetical protein
VIWKSVDDIEIAGIPYNRQQKHFAVAELMRETTVSDLNLVLKMPNTDNTS